VFTAMYGVWRMACRACTPFVCTHCPRGRWTHHTLAAHTHTHTHTLMIISLKPTLLLLSYFFVLVYPQSFSSTLLIQPSSFGTACFHASQQTHALTPPDEHRAISHLRQLGSGCHQPSPHPSPGQQRRAVSTYMMDNMQHPSPR
jgi:hypothetical protein